MDDITIAMDLSQSKEVSNEESRLLQTLSEELEKMDDDGSKLKASNAPVEVLETPTTPAIDKADGPLNANPDNEKTGVNYIHVAKKPRTGPSNFSPSSGGKPSELATSFDENLSDSQNRVQEWLRDDSALGAMAVMPKINKAKSGSGKITKDAKPGSDGGMKEKKGAKGKGKVTKDAEPGSDGDTKEKKSTKGKRKVTESGEDPSDEGSQDKKPGRAKQTREVKGSGRKPSANTLKYAMDHYKIFDATTLDHGEFYDGAHTSYSNYDGFLLFMTPSITDANLVPKTGIRGGIRIDDYHIAIVLESGLFSKSQLTRHWQGEFDKNGMTRATRAPLGHAAKVLKNEGDTDIDGNVLGSGEGGWFYLWHRGLQMLGGQESIDADIVWQRPSFEKDRCSGTTWKKSHRAVIQLPPGHPADKTFLKMDDLPDFCLLPWPPESNPLAERGGNHQEEDSGSGKVGDVGSSTNKKADGAAKARAAKAAKAKSRNRRGKQLGDAEE